MSKPSQEGKANSIQKRREASSAFITRELQINIKMMLYTLNLTVDEKQNDNVIESQVHSYKCD